jgi:nitroreductase
MVMKFEELKKLLEKDRTVRRFDESAPIDLDKLYALIELVRYCASGRNAQTLRYRIVSTQNDKNSIFPYLAWAGYYKDWDGPADGERPAAYLIQCQDTSLGNANLCDEGLQLQAITLGAITLGLNCCIIKSFNLSGIVESLNLPSRYKPLYVLAIGYPKEDVKIVDMKDDGDFKYYRDENDVQCVPKRSLDELII